MKATLRYLQSTRCERVIISALAVSSFILGLRTAWSWLCDWNSREAHESLQQFIVPYLLWNGSSLVARNTAPLLRSIGVFSIGLGIGNLGFMATLSTTCLRPVLASCFFVSGLVFFTAEPSGPPPPEVTDEEFRTAIKFWYGGAGFILFLFAGSVLGLL